LPLGRSYAFFRIDAILLPPQMKHKMPITKTQFADLIMLKM
jgi:hypothetical protein